MPQTNIYYPYNNFKNNPSAGSSQYVLNRHGKNYTSNNITLPNVPMTFIKNNNRYYKSHTSVGRVGQSSQGGNLNAIKRRV